MTDQSAGKSQSKKPTDAKTQSSRESGANTGDTTTAEFGPEAEVLDDQRPIIRLEAGELARVVDHAEAALIAAEKSIFSRAGKLVRPIVEKVTASKGRTTNIVILRELKSDSLVDQLSRVARFERPRVRDGVTSWMPVDPPSRVAETLLSREGSWKFPPIAGVINTPTVRLNGTLLAKPGYDPETRLFLSLDDDLKIPRIPARPSKAQARVALKKLLTLLLEFPFVGHASRSVALSGILTPLVRPTLPAAPMHFIRASTPSTGKSYLVDLFSAIATGRRMPVITAGQSAEETDKRLGALILAGCPLISIDNLEHDIGGSTLCQTVERPLVQIRILGRSEMPECECRATLFATGNNVSILDDMVRRTVLCEMATDMERPELRKFNMNPFDMVLENRGAFIGAALTIMMAYIAAGRPNVCDPLASYEDWTQMVRGSLIWLGEVDPVVTMEKLRTQDPFIQNISEFFREVEKHEKALCDENGIFTSAKLIEIGEKGFDGKDRPELYNLLLRVAAAGTRISPVRLGKWLSRIADRVVDGRRLRKWEDAKSSNRFWLESVPNATP